MAEAEQLLESVQFLVDAKQWHSAKLLGEVLTSRAALTNADNVVRGLRLYAESLFNVGDLAAALKRAEEAIAVSIRQESGQNDANLARMIVGRCQVALGDRRKAVAAFLEIPETERTLDIWMDIARSQHALQNLRDAAVAYTQALSLCPFVVEASMALSELRSSADSANAAVQTVDPPILREWLTIANTFAAACRNMDVEGCITASKRAAVIAPMTPHPHIWSGRALAGSGELVSAVAAFERARATEPGSVEAMDSFGFALSSTAPSRLPLVVPNILKSAPQRSEVWVMAGWYAFNTSAHDRALTYADRAMALATTSSQIAGAEMLRGSVMTVLNRPGRAATAFRTAYTESPSLMSLKGLVTAYGNANRPRDALAAAKAALNAAPSNPIALTVMGKALSFVPQDDARVKAKKNLKQALTLDPACEDAALVFADVAMLENDFAGIVEVLNGVLAHRTSVALHIRIGVALSASGNQDQAVSHLQSALAMNPTSDEAKSALENVLKLIRGTDTDAENGSNVSGDEGTGLEEDEEEEEA